MMKFWPPLLGAGIKIHYVSKAIDSFEVRMKLKWYNRNIINTHFGGSLYSMCDPFFMLILMCNLGNKYIVWDKAANIKFKKPGKTMVSAKFHIDQRRIKEIKNEVDINGKMEYTFCATVINTNNEVVAEVEKLIYIRRKDFVRNDGKKEDLISEN